jgi:Undecaprenyl-phosphate glucose phosphotransferase
MLNTSGEKLTFLLIWIIIAAAVSLLLLCIKRKVILSILHLGRRHYGLVSKVILVGDNIDAAKAFVKEVTKDTSGNIMLIGAVGRKMTEQIGCEKLGDIEDFEQILYKYRPDYVVFAFDSYGKEGTIKLVNLCNDNCVKTYFLPAIYGFFKSSRQVEHLGSLPLINAHSTPLDNPMNAFIKRTIDIFGSLALIIITSPIMIAAAIGVKISSPGPIFFRQLRVGRMGKQFYMLKFRSMRVNDKSGTAWSTGVDDRKTKFGNFMRRTSIDELPQFFNVLAGNMSLVGPRPEIPHFVEYFKDKIPLYMIKHYVKPGITGLAQIKGLRGDTSIEDRIHEDINYIESWSLGLDIYILLKTPFKAVNKSEVYVNTEEKGDEEEDD